MPAVFVVVVFLVVAGAFVLLAANAAAFVVLIIGLLALFGLVVAAVRVIELDHIVLNVADVERSLRFYVDEVGLVGERVDEWRKQQVFFPSVRVNAARLRAGLWSMISSPFTMRSGPRPSNVFRAQRVMLFRSIGSSMRMSTASFSWSKVTSAVEEASETTRLKVPNRAFETW